MFEKDKIVVLDYATVDEDGKELKFDCYGYKVGETYVLVPLTELFNYESRNYRELRMREPRRATFLTAEMNWVKYRAVSKHTANVDETDAIRRIVTLTWSDLPSEMLEEILVVFRIGTNAQRQSGKVELLVELAMDGRVKLPLLVNAIWAPREFMSRREVIRIVCPEMEQIGLNREAVDMLLRAANLVCVMPETYVRDNNDRARLAILDWSDLEIILTNSKYYMEGSV